MKGDLWDFLIRFSSLYIIPVLHKKKTKKMGSLCAKIKKMKRL